MSKVSFRWCSVLEASAQYCSQHHSPSNGCTLPAGLERRVRWLRLNDHFFHPPYVTTIYRESLWLERIPRSRRPTLHALSHIFSAPEGSSSAVMQTLNYSSTASHMFVHTLF
jgi:hypothetical protein